MKEVREIMEILETYDLVESYRETARLCECDHKAVAGGGASRYGVAGGRGGCS